MFLARLIRTPRPFPAGFSAVIALLAVLGTPGRSRAAWLPAGNPIAANPQGETQPGIVPDGTGGVLVGWRDGTQRIAVRHVLPNGSFDPGWPGAGATAVLGNFVIDPVMCSDGAGGVIVVWVDYRNPPLNTNRDLYAQRILADGTLAWAAGGIPVCTAPHDQYYERIIPDGSGGALIAWLDYRNDPGNFTHISIFAVRLDASGNPAPGWTAGGTLVAPGSIPSIAPDGAGGLLIAWTTQDVHVQHMTGAGAPAPGWPDTGIVVCDAPDLQSGVLAVADGAGGVHLAWQDRRLGDDRAHLYGVRVTGDGSYPAGWAKNGKALCVAPQNQYVMDGQPDGTGGVVWVWQDWRDAFPPSPHINNTDIMAQHVLGDGALLWGLSGLGVCTNFLPQDQARITPDGMSGWFVGWSDFRSGIWRAYATHLDAAGLSLPGWPVNGQPMTQGAAAQSLVALAPDLVGGAYAVWTQYAENFDVFATRLAGNGPVETVASLVSAEAAPGRVRIEWSVAPDARATLEATPPGGTWRTVQETIADGRGRIAYESGGLSAGRWGFRIRLAGRPAGETWLDVPAALLALRITPGADGGLTARLALPAPGTARIEVFDVAGRRRFERSLDVAAAGSSSVPLAAPGVLSPGPCWARLTFGRQTVVARSCVLR
jgi:hypothetical protein